MTPIDATPYKSHPFDENDRWEFLRVGALSLLILIAASILAPARADDAYRWLQASADGWQARAVTQNDTCPVAEIDGHSVVMTPRARPGEGFPITICAVNVPKGAKSLSIDGAPLAPPPPRVDKILVFGDTGCRLKGMFLQDCNSIRAWPFRLTADMAAEFAPDLVIHVGDYHYRETACPASVKGCAGSPHGDNWATWKADFFEPGGALLRAAPWVLVRGNHEICARAGKGWTRALSPLPPAEDGRCVEREQAYRVDIDDPTLFVLDATEAEERTVVGEQAAFLRKQLAIAKDVPGPVWYAFHKPIFSLFRSRMGETLGVNETLAAAAHDGLPPGVQAILSGHLHAFEALSFREDRPAQFVVGVGGTAMDPHIPANFDGTTIGEANVEQGRGVAATFGFAIFERGDGEWIVTDYDAHAKPLLRCHLRGRKIDCD
ncbi:metallophosphoesterase [Methylosinus sp. H3A]|uniref:metallophosphoesterase family protein n=1 Tax=Methylosinus sp. H3A TaxID=2785786 RepID=UPI0018C3509E|nr:metallophosphoesterase [Methylosinus sp. H3A]MBG0808838.1 metallophosphoesterase [Methylosinus sp. H3A]